MRTSITLEEMARQAIEGDPEAREGLVQVLQADIYGLSLRMLWNREDAEDATQEILFRIVTRLPRFDFRSRLRTWAYRVAVNFILDTKKSAIEQLHLSFERFAEDLTGGLQPAAPDETERSVLIEEVKVACTTAMLQCLDRPHRLAYILGELLDFSGPEAAEALGISRALFRKRLQQARRAILEFTKTHCGLVSDEAGCSCNRRVGSATLANLEGLQPIQFACRSTSFAEIRALVRQVDETRWASEVHRTNQPKASSVELAHRLMESFERARDYDSTS